MDEVTEKEIRLLAIETFIDKSIADEWFQTTIPALGGKVPETMMRTQEGNF